MGWDYFGWCQIVIDSGWCTQVGEMGLTGMGLDSIHGAPTITQCKSRCVMDPKAPVTLG